MYNLFIYKFIFINTSLSHSDAQCEDVKQLNIGGWDGDESNKCHFGVSPTIMGSPHWLGWAHSTVITTHTIIRSQIFSWIFSARIGYCVVQAPIVKRLGLGLGLGLGTGKWEWEIESTLRPRVSQYNLTGNHHPPTNHEGVLWQKSAYSKYVSGWSPLPIQQKKITRWTAKITTWGVQHDQEEVRVAKWKWK